MRNKVMQFVYKGGVGNVTDTGYAQGKYNFRIYISHEAQYLIIKYLIIGQCFVEFV